MYVTAFALTDDLELMIFFLQADEISPRSFGPPHCADL